MIYVQMQGLEEIESALDMARDKSKQVLRSAINDTAASVRDSLVEGANEKYQYSKRKIKSTMKTKRAKTGRLLATVTSTAPVSELYDFKVSPHSYNPRRRPEWYEAKAKRQGAMQKIALRMNAPRDKYKAFVVRYKSGHVTLAQRVPGRRMKNNPKKEFVKSLLTTSVPHMEAEVYDERLSGQVEDILADAIAKRIQQML